MNDHRTETLLENEHAVETLLGKARPRPVPPQADSDAVREAVQAEWRQVTGQRQRKRRLVQFAMAASVLLAAFLSLNLLRTNGVEPVLVASIDKQYGIVRIIGQESEVLTQPDLSQVIAGQAIRTGADSGAGLEWNGGGSLRIGANTRIELRSATDIYLESGSVYFDSTPALAAISGSGRLTIHTQYGEVTHIGTRYVVTSGAAGMAVSVRDGVVEVLPTGDQPVRATNNQQLTVSGSGAHQLASIQAYGAAWEWIERTSPAVDLDGRSVDEFLRWVGHETGLSLEYESADAEAYARDKRLNGELNMAPRDALAAWMLATDLDWRIEEGVIYVRNPE